MKYFAVYPLLTPAQGQAHMCGGLWICLHRQMAALSKVTVHKSPFFFCSTAVGSLTTSSTLYLPPHTLNLVFSLSLKLSLSLPESDRALRSSWRRSLCPVWSRPRSSPSCPAVYLSFCVSSPAVALASHLSVKSPSVVGHFERTPQIQEVHSNNACGVLVFSTVQGKHVSDYCLAFSLDRTAYFQFAVPNFYAGLCFSVEEMRTKVTLNSDGVNMDSRLRVGLPQTVNYWLLCPH